MELGNFEFNFGIGDFVTKIVGEYREKRQQKNKTTEGRGLGEARPSN